MDVICGAAGEGMSGSLSSTMAPSFARRFPKPRDDRSRESVSREATTAWLERDPLLLVTPNVFLNIEDPSVLVQLVLQNDVFQLNYYF